MNVFLESSTINLRNLTDEETTDNQQFNERKWEWGFLRKKCQNLELEQFYQVYMQRMRISYLSLFNWIQAIVVTVHIAILLFNVKPLANVTIDICIYIGASVAILIILSINFREKLIRRKPWIMYTSSWLAITVLTMADISIPVYHAINSNDTLRPTYYSYVLYAIYIFMPLPENVHAFILGMAVTVSYLICFAFVTLRKTNNTQDTFHYTELLSEGIFLISINMLGFYFRLMQEIAIRTTFLDRRQCVEENLLLRYAREQEKSLLLSIIPAQIANKIEQDVKVRIEHMKMTSNIRVRTSTSTARKLFIEPHNDVTILYADVVNYTYLTTTLDVKTLVETIHDLFVKFDTASEEFNVLRIKFLGDCYYCVAGVPIPNPYHAKCCVELGLRMIKDIRDVRAKRKLDIDMRIGVHSGNILSGVIGACKWQFDIWSKDVDIANRLEQTGQAGRVHVSEQSLKLLDGEYMYEEGPLQARTDRVLRKYRIHTFLIKPPKEGETSLQPFIQRDLFRPSVGGVKRQILKEQRSASNRTKSPIQLSYIDLKTSKTDVSTNFMQNTILQYNQIRTQAKLEMSRELDKMPIGRIQFSKFCFSRSKRLTLDEMEEQNFRSNITSLCLFFKDRRWEWKFMKEPDVMLKYSIVAGLITFVAIMAIQAINDPQSMTFWIVSLSAFVILLLLVIIAWYKKLWMMFWNDLEILKPTKSFSILMFNLSENIQTNIFARVCIYFFIVIMHCACTLMQLFECNRIQVENEEIEIQIFQGGQHSYLCFHPWIITESLILATCMCFLFTRIPFVLKLAVGFSIIVAYAIIVLFEYDFIYEKSNSTNLALYTEYAHLLVLFITLGIFHMMDRQTEFISKVDYNWKRQLQKKQDDAKFTNETIKILINNILPTHVADIYMSKRMKNELYYEEYENVAVMFATIRNYDTEKVGLRVLNEIICDFDEVLNSYKGPLKIEKIKVAGWTYMAACGLDLTRSEHVNSQSTFRNSSLLPNGRRSQHTDTRTNVALDLDVLPSTSSATSMHQYEGTSNNAPQTSLSKRRSRKISSPQQNNVVYVMAQFALDLMRTMHSFNVENMQFEDADVERGMLRIGISNGEIMAGVVGSYKPHYDIWGNAVNMASRMDSTGIAGSIQVTEDTAQILQTFDIKCTLRGLTYVKGRGEIPTYFVEVDKDLNFIKESPATSNTNDNKLSFSKDDSPTDE